MSDAERINEGCEDEPTTNDPPPVVAPQATTIVTGTSIQWWDAAGNRWVKL